MMLSQPKPSSLFADSENFTVPEDPPSSTRFCQYASSDYNSTKDNYLKRLNTMNSMNFASLVKPSPFQKSSYTLHTPDSSPVMSKLHKTLPLSKNNSTVSTCPYFLGSNLNLTSLPPKEEIDPLVESIRSDMEPEERENDENDINDLNDGKPARKSIIKMGEKSRFSKRYPSLASVLLLLPDMTSYNSLEDVALPDGEEVLYPNKYVIEVSESEESDESEEDPNTMIGYQGEQGNIQQTLVQFSVHK